MFKLPYSVNKKGPRHAAQLRESVYCSSLYCGFGRIPGPVAVPRLLRCRDNWLLCNDYLPRTVITITGYFRDPMTW